jgi:hypothetical protein
MQLTLTPSAPVRTFLFVFRSDLDGPTPQATAVANYNAYKAMGSTVLWQSNAVVRKRRSNI